MKRKIRLIATAVALSGLALSGCAGAGSGTAEGDDITLTYAIWDDTQRAGVEAVVKAFEQENENVTVKVQVDPWDQYWTKMQTTLTGGKGPDVFWMNAVNLPLYASEGQLVDLTADVDTTKYADALVSMASYDGKVYGAPRDVDSVALWYNKKLFADAGVTEPTADWTWQDMQDAAAQLTGDGVFGFAASAARQQNIYPSIFSAGGEVISSDKASSAYGSPEDAEGVEFMYSFIEAGSSPTIQQMTDTEPMEMFGSGKVAMYWAQNTQAAFFAQSAAGADIQVAPLPQGPAGSVSIIHGLTNVVNASSEHQDAAKAFATFASGPKGAAILAEQHGAIPAYDGTAEEWVKGTPEYNLQVFVDGIQTAKPYPTTLSRPTWEKFEDELFPQIFAGEVSIGDGLTQLQSDIQKTIDAEKK